MKHSFLFFLLASIFCFSNCSGGAQESKTETEKSYSSELLNFDYNYSQEEKKRDRTKLDSICEIEISSINKPIHYSIKKMNTLFEIIPEMFNDQYIQDFWLSEYLKEHIYVNGIINSKKYIEQFYELCKTDQFFNEIDEYVTSEKQLRTDHEIAVYKSENEFNLEAHIFRPADNSALEKKPAVVIFHGGGWSIGSPTWAFKDAKHYSELGLIGISGHYRLSNRRDITPIEAMQDAKDLILWLKMNADSLGIDKNKIAVAGWSAGAHLAASTAIFADSLVNEKISSKPNALLLNSPAVDLANESWFNKMLNDRSVSAASLSPLEFVVKGLPPTILLQGRDDTVTPLKGTQLFYDKMNECGNYCELWIYDNVGHLFTPSHLNDRGQPKPDKEIQKKAVIKTDEFLKKIGFI